MNLFLVQSEKTQEINGITQTESNPAMKPQYSKSAILCGTSKQLRRKKRRIGGWLELRVPLHGFRTSYRCPLHHLRCLSAPRVTTFLPLKLMGLWSRISLDTSAGAAVLFCHLSVARNGLKYQLILQLYSITSMK